MQLYIHLVSSMVMAYFALKFPSSSFGQEFELYYTKITGLKETDSSETMKTGLLALNLLFTSQEVTQKWVSVIIITDEV